VGIGWRVRDLGLEKEKSELFVGGSKLSVDARANLRRSKLIWIIVAVC